MSMSSVEQVHYMFYDSISQEKGPKFPQIMEEFVSW
ncbi:unnamed protein product [Ectocarpus sp. 12 AP-2014]